MNKGCFRLVFSTIFGCLIPVAEIARSRRKPGQCPDGLIDAMPLRIQPAPILKPLSLAVLLAGLPNWAAAEILLDRISPGPSVISSANGVPVIEIANPNGNGLSHNRFGQFDVANPGVIFNNSMVNGTSQIGGAVLLNPNLKQTAKAILTEITGNRPSSISGTLEVFGDAADLLIAYPNVKLAKEDAQSTGQARNQRKYLINFADVLREVHTVVDLTTPADLAKYDLTDYRPSNAGEAVSKLRGYAAEFQLINRNPHNFIADATSGGLGIKLTYPDGSVAHNEVKYLNIPVSDLHTKETGWLNSIAADINEARTAAKDADKCVAIHCTTGVGRTGMVIVAAQLQTAYLNRKLDTHNTKHVVDEMILALRNQRSDKMVHNATQYRMLRNYANDLTVGKFDASFPVYQKLDAATATADRTQYVYNLPSSASSSGAHAWPHGNTSDRYVMLPADFPSAGGSAAVPKVKPIPKPRKKQRPVDEEFPLAVEPIGPNPFHPTQQPKRNDGN